MFLSNPETCARGEAFDHIVEQTGRALRDPRVVQKIGQELVSSLLETHDQLFLPDVRHGMAFIPEAYKQKVGVALLPVTTQEIPTLETMKAPLLASFIRHWSFGTIRADGYKALVSRYGVQASFEDIEKSVHNRCAGGDNEDDRVRNPLVCTNARFQLVNDRFSVSRPLIIAQYDELFKYPDEIAETGAHELVHADDALWEAPLIAHEPFIIASEYCAYHVEDAINVVTRQSEEVLNTLPGEVEAFRQQHADPTRPFYPTPAMIDKAYEFGIV